MNCGMECIKYLLFFFNFILAICGLVILGVGLAIKTGASKLISDNIEFSISLPAIIFVVIGAIIFIITFFGCCGAIRESHCMIVTFGVLLLTVLVIQVAIAAVAFLSLKGTNIEKNIERGLEMTIHEYFDGNKAVRDYVDTLQTAMSCCGYDGYQDYLLNEKNVNRTIPYSCCNKLENQSCRVEEVKYDGCKGKLYPLFQVYAHNMGGLALGIAAVEFTGVIFSFCLANSIRNYERRGYKV